MTDEHIEDMEGMDEDICDEEDLDFEDVMAAYTPILALTEIGIENKMTPKEVVAYFKAVMDEYAKEIWKVEKEEV